MSRFEWNHSQAGSEPCCHVSLEVTLDKAGCVGHLQVWAYKDIYLDFPKESSPMLLGSAGSQLDVLLEGWPWWGWGSCSQPRAAWAGLSPHPCVVMALQRLLSGGFLGSLTASMRREHSRESFSPSGGQGTARRNGFPWG